MHPSHIFSLIFVSTLWATARAAYPPYYKNISGCLNAYVESMSYHIVVADHPELIQGTFDMPKFDTSASTCLDANHRGVLQFKYDSFDNNALNDVTFTFQIQAHPLDKYWEVNQALINVNSKNKGLIPDGTYEMKTVDIYAANDYSFSCGALILQNKFPAADKPQFKMTIKRFQLQPFKDLPNYVFASSYDCSVWLTLPQIMGLILLLFTTVTVLVPIRLMLDLGNQSSDLKFCKQGGMLMNQAQLDATKG